MVHVPPSPQVLDRPGTIRWAVGRPEGPRSHTWSVIGHANDDDVFIGLRDRMGDMKLSLHPTKWRMAYTDQGAAARQLPPDVDRVLSRWEHPPELAPGWRHGAVITIAPSNLGPGYPEKRVRGGGEVAWFPATEQGWVLRFDVLLGSPDRGELTINDCVGEVGRMTLSSGAGVWVIATEVRTPPEYEAGLIKLRSYARGLPADGTEPRGWAWGHTDDERIPALIDLSNLTAE